MIPDIEEKDLTPLMRQYLAIKKQHPDTILFYRMGDFYEMFFDDAEVGARELDITLTARDKGPYGGKIPLAGIPYHALDSYLPKMVKKGYKVAIAEQVEDPKKAKGIVKREVVRIVTPGTLLMPQGYEEKGNTYLSALVREVSKESKEDLPMAEDKGPSQEKIVLPKASYGLAHLDISTGDFFTTEIRDNSPFQTMISELLKFSPAEIVVPASLSEKKEFMTEVRIHLGEQCAVTSFPDHHFLETYSEKLLKEQFKVVSIEGLGLQDNPLAVSSAGGVLAYARENQMCDLAHIRNLRTYTGSEFMILDSTTLRNLEVIRSFRDGSTKGTLLEVLDHTRTAMGSRMLRNWVQQPLMDVSSIQRRLDAVETLFNDLFLRSDLKEALKRITDIERIVMRLTLKRGSARDLNSLRGSLEASSDLRELLDGSDSAASCDLLGEMASSIADLSELSELVASAVVENPPLSTRDGGMIKQGYSGKLDEISSAARDSKEWLKGFETREKKRLGIRSLKVKHNNVFGYYIEVTRSNLHLVPEDYIRKQTLVNAERYITPELKEKESIILNSQERMSEMEIGIFEEIVATVLSRSGEILGTARSVASLDVLSTLSEIASRKNYTRPGIDQGRGIELIGSRHPVIEDRVEWGFVPNDLSLDGSANRFMVLTGPNMAGKSTYMRQVALIVIMAQMGSFVPAENAKIGLVDRIFTRVGASDDIARGQSTFMVEMLELGNILNSATERSLVLLDEIGRGTSTFDGLSIAWAVTEFISDREKIGCNAIFATHYHHLTELESSLEGVVNYSMAVKDDRNGITFLRKVRKGPASRSYGVEVADLAGLPSEVVERARELLERIEKEDVLEGRTQAIATGEKLSEVPISIK
ncbi:MAG: DNA mismatch repair protein MutS, partial [Candidatus Thermoplasmatota archaeon]|nr:DNA mismatch repair protein MutS [Candidatus Thermoplasmatota archaeon]